MVLSPLFQYIVGNASKLKPNLRALNPRAPNLNLIKGSDVNIYKIYQLPRLTRLSG